MRLSVTGIASPRSGAGTDTIKSDVARWLPGCSVTLPISSWSTHRFLGHSANAGAFLR